MNPVGLAMDALLIAMLALALVLGLRLSRQLKALRAGQGDFVRAVGELDAAALRAEAGLAELRRATEDTHDSLLARIETARALVGKLEAVSAEAEVAAARAVRPSPSGAGRAPELEEAPRRAAARALGPLARLQPDDPHRPTVEPESRAATLLAELQQRRRVRRSSPEDELFEAAGDRR